jgi:hypothetical protein
MRLALLLLSCGLAFGQVQIHYSRQSDVVTKALVGTIPQGVALYRAEVINVGTGEARVFPARVGFEAAAVAPMQDPEAAIFAAMEYKKTRWWVVGLKAAATLAPYGGAALLGLQAFGVKIPDSANTIAGSLNGGTALFNALHQESAKLTIPATWLRDGLPEIILRPGEPVAYLLALGGNPPATFSAEVSFSRNPQPPSMSGETGDLLFRCNPINGGACIDGTGKESLHVQPLISESVINEKVGKRELAAVPVSTHPQIPDEDEARALQVASWVRERSAGVSQ